MSDTVFITGASGFIAQHVVKQLIEKGYKVVGTVRTEEKGEKLKANAGPNFEYEIVPDIAEPGAFNQALEKHPEVRGVLHTASPFFFAKSDLRNAIIKPAVEGTKNALESVLEHGHNVTRVVITSSFAAVTDAIEKPTTVFTEKSWNPVTWDDDLEDPLNGYRASKTFAEKSAWEFVEKHKPKFSLNVVNPVFVLGPQAYDNEVKETLNTSAELINSLLKLGPNGTFDDRKGGFTDVRDTAKAHLYALETPTSGLRLLLYESRYSTQVIVDIIRKHFPHLEVPKGKPGASVQEITDNLAKIDNSATRKLLGDFIDLETSVVDALNQLLKDKSS